MSSTSPVVGVVSHLSQFSVDNTRQRLEQIIRDRGLTLFAHFDHSGEAAKAGLTMPPAHVLVFGNPRAGTPLMIASPLVALDLPLRVLVWQDVGGQARDSDNEPAFLAQRFQVPPDRVGAIA